MKAPNFRLYTTQARAATWIGMIAVLLIAVMAVLVFKGMNWKEKAIYYNAGTGMGKFRPWLVQGTAGVMLLAGASAGLLGFNSLGQKRNDKQGLSWMGVLLGAVSIVFALLLWFAWRTLSEPIITST